MKKKTSGRFTFRGFLSLILLCLCLGLAGCSGDSPATDLTDAVKVMTEEETKEQKKDKTSSKEDETEASDEKTQTEQNTKEDDKSDRQDMSGELTVHYLDVGQGNSIFVECDGQTMLIDGGPADASSYVVSYLRQQGIDDLDYVLVSHYDSDHVSGIVGVLHAFDVDTVLNPDYTTDTKIYRSYLSALDSNGCEVLVPEQGDTFTLGEATFTVVGPVEYNYREANNQSIGIRIEHGDNHFLILGDMELESEYDVLDSGVELQAEVYMASHHGSSSSSSERLMEAVNPEVVVISAGKGNSYGHPSADTMERFEELGLTMYRTDQQGTICAVSDGSEIRFDTKPCKDWTPGNKEDKGGSTSKSDSKTEDSNKGNQEGAYIGNANSLKFHEPGCSSLPAEENRVYFSTREEAVQKGYDPCGRCRP